MLSGRPAALPGRGRFPPRGGGKKRRGKDNRNVRNPIWTKPIIWSIISCGREETARKQYTTEVLI